jgi:membrane-bound serine protease (ClpP class)
VITTLAALVLALASQEAAVPARPAAGDVVVAEIDGIIHPIAAEFLDDVLAEADATGARLTVLVLRTPGGLVDATRGMVDRMIRARAPVVVFVGPSGARAASAGFLLALAADVTAMAPGTHIGAAHPVASSGQDIGETMRQKAAEDVAAFARTLAQARGRNVALSAAAVIESRAFTEREALEAAPPLIDLIAADVPALLAQLEGRTIHRFDGRAERLHTAGAAVRTVRPTRRQQFLGALAHPQIATLLISLGILGLTVELWTPGAIAPGVVGVVALLLGFFGLQVLSVSVTGLLLIAVGVALLLLELKVPSIGALGVGGTISLVLGVVMTATSVPGLTVSLPPLIAVALVTAAAFLFLGRLALRAQRQPPATGMQTLVGTRARTLTPLGAGRPGQAALRGEIWRVVATTPVDAGRDVRVTGVDGLTLTVEPVEPDGGQGGR